MRDPERIDVICKNLAKLWKYFPDQRLGQLIENYLIPQGKLFFQEDDDTLENIMNLLYEIEDTE